MFGVRPGLRFSCQDKHRKPGLTPSRNVVHTLMTSLTVTMTISVARTTSPDLFVENESLLFDHVRASHISDTISPLAAITFSAEKSSPSIDLKELATACGSNAISLATSKEGKERRVWLFVSQRPWQPANRIVRHRKLWKDYRELIESGGIVNVSDEVEITSEDGIRFAGLLEVTGSSIETALQLVRTNPACAMICSKRKDIDSHVSIRSIFSFAFPKEDGIEQVHVDWMTLALGLCPLGDVLIRVSGLFDDHEAAVDVIALQEYILSL